MEHGAYCDYADIVKRCAVPYLLVHSLHLYLLPLPPPSPFNFIRPFAHQLRLPQPVLEQHKPGWTRNWNEERGEVSVVSVIFRFFLSRASTLARSISIRTWPDHLLHFHIGFYNIMQYLPQLRTSALKNCASLVRTLIISFVAVDAST